MTRASPIAERLALSLIALVSVPAQEPTTSDPARPAVAVEVGVPSPLFAAAAAELRRLPGVGSVQPFAAAAHESAAAAEAPVLLVAVSEFALARLAARGRLRALPALGRALPRRCRDSLGRYVLPFAMRYTMAYDPLVVPADAAPATWEQLATRPELRTGLGMVDPAADPVPWLCAMTQATQRGSGDQAGFALWMSLDAHMAVYAGNYDELLSALVARRIAATVLPVAIAETWRAQSGLSPLPNRPFDEGCPLSRLGIAIDAPEQADIAAVTQTAEALLEVSTRSAFARALGLEAVAEERAGAGQPTSVAAAEVSVDPDYDWQQADRWLEHFGARIRGKGRATEDFADWFDFAFALLFLGFILFVWLRLRRVEAPRP